MKEATLSKETTSEPPAFRHGEYVSCTLIVSTNQKEIEFAKCGLHYEYSRSGWLPTQQEGK